MFRDREKVLIYQPQDVGKYAKPNDGIELFLNHVTKTNAPELQGQFRWFAYLRPGEWSNQLSYAGLIYLRDIHDKSDPLANVDGITMIQGFRKMAEHIGAKVLSAEFGCGRLEMEAHVLENIQRVIGWALAPHHGDYRLTPPKEVSRFILNLVPEANDRIIAPFLESKRYKGKFQFVTLQEDSQLSLADPGN